MAVNPIQFLVAQNASITDGTKTITISGNVDCSRVYSGTAIFLGGADNPAEAVSGTSPDGSGNSTITLRNSWSQGDIVNQQLVSFNTNEGLAEAISNVREIVSNVSAIEDLSTQGLIKRINDNEYEVVSISALGEALVGASDASSARSSLGLGSAATKDVGEAAGNVMERGAFGLGSTGKFVSFTDWHQLANYETGFYTSFQSDQNSATNSPPITTANTNYAIFVQRDGVRVKITAYVSKGVQSFTKTYTGSAWTDWFENYDSGNSINPLNIGLGIRGTSTNISNFDSFRTDNAFVSGAYRYSSGTVDSPSGLGANGTVLFLSRATSDGTLLAIDTSGNLASKAFDNSGGVSGHLWNTFYHSGNSVNPLDYGIKTHANLPAISDLNTIGASLLTSVVDSSTQNRPDSAVGHVINLSQNDAANSQIVTDRIYNDIWFRTSSGGVYKDFSRLYHSGNTNFNVLEGNGVGDGIATGYMATGGTARFFVPLNSLSTPNSISVQGTFSVREINSVINTGITSISLSGGSSNKIGLLEVTGLTGTAGNPVVLQIETTSSTITFNF